MLQSRWLIFFPIALFAWFSPNVAKAEQVGLIAVGYSITEIPPTKSDAAYTECGREVVPFINVTFDFEQNQFGACGWDSFMIHYTGYIQIPEHQTIEFWVASDDGGTVKIGTEEFGVWQDQGCSATETGLMDISPGTKLFDGWFYENGGGTCFMLAWNVDNTGWTIVPPEAFTSQPSAATTTTVLSTTTTEIPASTTTASATSTSLFQISTTELTTTTTQLPTTTTSTNPPQPVVPVETAPSTTETTVTDTTTTETLPEETTVPVEPFPDPTDNAPISPPDTPESDLSVVIPETTESPTTTADVPVEVVSEQEITDEVFSQALENLADASESEVQAIVEELLTGDLSTEQATELVTDVALLSAVTPEQAQAIFEEIQPAQLSEAMAEVIAEALNDPSVPTEVKEAFEESINIFGNDGFSDYVPVDSVVSVAVRRTVIATTAILVAIPAPAVRRNP